MSVLVTSVRDANSLRPPAPLPLRWSSTSPTPCGRTTRSTPTPKPFCSTAQVRRSLGSISSTPTRSPARCHSRAEAIRLGGPDHCDSILFVSTGRSFGSRPRPLPHSLLSYRFYPLPTSASQSVGRSIRRASPTPRCCSTVSTDPRRSCAWAMATTLASRATSASPPIGSRPRLHRSERTSCNLY